MHSLIWGVPLVKPKRITVQALITIVGLTLILVIIRLVDVIHDNSIGSFYVGRWDCWWSCRTRLVVVLDQCVPVGGWARPGATCSLGAVLFGIGVQMLHVLTVVWIARSLESKSETYGALGAALTILLWAYLLGRLVTAVRGVGRGALERQAPAPGVIGR